MTPMTPDPRLVPHAQCLPLDARRALVARGGPGWWVVPPDLIGPLLDAPDILWGARHLDSAVIALAGDIEGEHPVVRRLAAGWLYWPASEVAWMDAATPEGGTWTAISGRWRIVRDAGPSHSPRHRWEIVATAPSAVECALRAWGVL